MVNLRPTFIPQFPVWVEQQNTEDAESTFCFPCFPYSFPADESVDGDIVKRPRQDGHDVLYVAEMQPGITDDLVLKQANENQALLMTIDKDFGELVFRPGRIHNGVILVRLSGLSSDKKAETVSTAIMLHGTLLNNSFSVISPGRIRIRPKP
ncbi:MAG: DUF5615 family PIN-like protein [Acidobacteria bacterium]|nr:DUF5615 family PIN-like protein [Acidobacteriota bacterium]